MYGRPPFRLIVHINISPGNMIFFSIKLLLIFLIFPRRQYGVVLTRSVMRDTSRKYSTPVKLQRQKTLPSDMCARPLRKEAYSNILKILPPKNENFSDKNTNIFHFFCSKHRLWVLVRAASDLGLQYLPVTLSGVSRLQWVGQLTNAHSKTRRNI